MLVHLGSELGDLERAFPSGSSLDTIPREASLQSRVTETDSALSSRPRPGPRVTSHPAAGQHASGTVAALAHAAVTHAARLAARTHPGNVL